MKVQIDGWILFGRHEWEHSVTPYYVFRNYDQIEGFVCVKEHSFEVEVPDNFDPRPKMVERLELQKKSITAEFNAKIVTINAQIQSLLAIEA